MSTPTASELWQLSVAEASRLLSNREISSAELTDACLERVATVDGQISAYVTVTADLARQQAADADRRIAAGEAEYLTGIPMQIKDLLCTNGIPTTCASAMLAGYVPVYDATAVARLREQGAVLLGKGNMDEFGMGSSTENSAFFPTRNPWDTGRVPGGSSGGSAAAVAAGAAPFALGTDTGGSIRQPASFCGVTGLKPTYGRVSRYGLVAYASSLDQVGPIARDAADCALILQAIAGHDPRDATSLPDPVPDYSAALTGDISGLRLGVPSEYFAEGPGSDGMDPGVRAAVTAAIDQLAALGAEIRRVSLPTTEYALACYYIIAPSECSANLARYDGVKYGYSYQGDGQGDGDMWEAMERTRQHGFGPEVKRRIMLGAFALSSGYYDAYYHKAQQVRTLIRQDFARVFQEVDALAAPVSPVVAFPIGERADDPVRMYLVDVYTLPVNMAGLPAMSVPCGFARSNSDQGLPVGLQLIGPHLSEPNLLNIAHAYQQATDWHRHRPAI
ncbi:MAG: Asp-tRNA(Asn)/Glu-tRNA(Gln) amidotransferase subunit GatA [Chloroflexota bacterium]|nr:Asp-tRNA(Asn)/Glu-tRNA(Gln) amidotransferase subunit GatA [Chloroflexota bacterium]MDE2960125.1 Asp-tRNA(Asn)/Glu-tRNA(Gln) amidotransferase subunit GatA [Chloroflexota bacterium]